MVLTAYSVISLAIGLSCHHRRRECRSIVADLISASRYQDHTALPSAPVRSSRASPRPSHPAPNVRDDRDTPLQRVRDSGKCAADLPDVTSESACGRLARRANHLPRLDGVSRESCYSGSCSRRETCPYVVDRARELPSSEPTPAPAAHHRRRRLRR